MLSGTDKMTNLKADLLKILAYHMQSLSINILKSTVELQVYSSFLDLLSTGKTRAHN